MPIPLAELPKGIEVGLITFAGSAQVVQPATLDRSALVGPLDVDHHQDGTRRGKHCSDNRGDDSRAFHLPTLQI